MKILTLPLKAKWYDLIESGIKTEEYREDKPYWRKRLMRSNDGFKPFTHIQFRYGYTQRTMIFECKEISIGMGNPKWGAPRNKEVFIIKLGAKCDPNELFIGKKGDSE